MIKDIRHNQSGFSSILLVVILGMIGYLFFEIKNREENIVESKLNFSSSVELERIKQKIKVHLRSTELCSNALGSSSLLQNLMDIDDLTSDVGGVTIGSPISENFFTKRIRLRDYPEDTDKLKVKANIEIEIVPIKAYRDLKKYSNGVKLLFPIVINKNKDRLRSCYLFESEIPSRLDKLLCQSFRGGDSADCEDPLEGFSRRMNTDFCNGLTGNFRGNCSKFISNVKCVGADLRGFNYENWSMNGIDIDGNAICKCHPRSCPNPRKYCKNIDLGTNWCEKSCGTGRRPSQNWLPKMRSVCKGVTFKQVSDCGEERILKGTLDDVDRCGGNCVDTEWLPSNENVCFGDVIRQRSNCGNLREIYGLKKTGDCLAAVMGATPKYTEEQRLERLRKEQEELLVIQKKKEALKKEVIVVKQRKMNCKELSRQPPAKFSRQLSYTWKRPTVGCCGDFRKIDFSEVSKKFRYYFDRDKYTSINFMIKKSDIGKKGRIQWNSGFLLDSEQKGFGIASNLLVTISECSGDFSGLDVEKKPTCRYIAPVGALTFNGKRDKCQLDYHRNYYINILQADRLYNIKDKSYTDPSVGTCRKDACVSEVLYELH